MKEKSHKGNSDVQSTEINSFSKKPPQTAS